MTSTARRLLKRTPDWLLFGVGSGILAALTAWFITGSLLSALKTLVIGGAVVLPIFRFWLLPPPPERLNKRS